MIHEYKNAHREFDKLFGLQAASVYFLFQDLDDNLKFNQADLSNLEVYNGYNHEFDLRKVSKSLIKMALNNS